MTRSLPEDRVKLAMILRGKYARLLIRLKTEGRIRSFTDGVLRALDLLAEKTAMQDIQFNQAESLRGNDE